MEKDNYYTPEIEDIRIGYEYEFHGMTVGGLTYLDNPELNIAPSIKVWSKEKCGISVWDRKPHDILELIKSNQIRTPYLTKEQIEAEGWKITKHEQKSNPYKVNWINAKKGVHTLWINLALINSMHLGVDTNNRIVFRGQCKSINEFRYIMKLLKI